MEASPDLPPSRAILMQRYTPKHWWPGDERDFIRSLKDVKLFGLDPEMCLTGYIKSLFKRKRWNTGTTEEDIQDFYDLAVTTLASYREEQKIWQKMK